MLPWRTRLLRTAQRQRTRYPKKPSLCLRPRAAARRRRRARNEHCIWQFSSCDTTLPEPDLSLWLLTNRQRRRETVRAFEWPPTTESAVRISTSRHIVPSSYTIPQQVSSSGCMQGMWSAYIRKIAVTRLLTQTHGGVKYLNN